MTAHTKTPWSVCHTTMSKAITHWHIVGDRHGSVYPICRHTIEVEPDAAEQIANAAHIVKCVNNHKSLMDALEALYHDRNRDTLDKALAALEAVWND